MKKQRSKLFSLTALLAFGVICIAPLCAQAAVLDLEDQEGKGYFYDEVTGYTWMDVDNFFDMSYADIEASIEGTSFRIATEEEVATLIESAGTDFNYISGVMGFGERVPGSLIIWGMYDSSNQPQGTRNSAYIWSDEVPVKWGYATIPDSTWQYFSDLGAFVVDTTPPPPPEPELISAVIEIVPGKLNRRSRGNWVRAYIELPDGFAVEDIDDLSVNLNQINAVPIDPPLYPVGATEIGDHDNDGVADLMVRLDRQELLALVELGEATVTVSGELVDGTIFEGTASLTIIEKYWWCSKFKKYEKSKKYQQFKKFKKSLKKKFLKKFKGWRR